MYSAWKVSSSGITAFKGKSHFLVVPNGSLFTYLVSFIRSSTLTIIAVVYKTSALVMSWEQTIDTEEKKKSRMQNISQVTCKSEVHFLIDKKKKLRLNQIHRHIPFLLMANWSWDGIHSISDDRQGLLLFVMWWPRNNMAKYFTFTNAYVFQSTYAKIINFVLETLIVSFFYSKTCSGDWNQSACAFRCNMRKLLAVLC